MGSGRKADAGWTYAAYQRNLRYQSAASGTVSDFDGSAETDTAASGCPTGAYTIDTFMESGSSWDSYQYWGGPSERLESPTVPGHAHISPVSRSADHLDVFVTDAQGAIFTAAWEPDFTDWWHGWWPLNGGAAAAGAPVHAVSRSTDKLDAFVIGTDTRVYTAAWEPDFTDWWHGW
jgi:hypothetical protein